MRSKIVNSLKWRIMLKAKFAISKSILTFITRYVSSSFKVSTLPRLLMFVSVSVRSIENVYCANNLLCYMKNGSSNNHSNWPEEKKHKFKMRNIYGYPCIVRNCVIFLKPVTVVVIYIYCYERLMWFWITIFNKCNVEEIKQIGDMPTDSTVGQMENIICSINCCTTLWIQINTLKLSLLNTKMLSEK